MIHPAKPQILTNGHVGWSPDFKADSKQNVVTIVQDSTTEKLRTLLLRCLRYMECHTTCRGEECPCGRAALEREISEALG